MKASQVNRLKKLEQAKSAQPKLHVTTAVQHDARHGCARAHLSDGRELFGEEAERAIEIHRKRLGRGEHGCWIIGECDLDKVLGRVLTDDEIETDRTRGFHGLPANPTEGDPGEGEEPAEVQGEGNHEPDDPDDDDPPDGDDPPDPAPPTPPAPPAPPTTPVEASGPQGEGFDAEKFFRPAWEDQLPTWRQQ